MGEAGGSNADLVLEGGGIKGIGLVGADLTLIEAGYQIHRVAGTSAGAIVGALIAAGMPPDLMVKTMREVDYGKFQDRASSITSAGPARDCRSSSRRASTRGSICGRGWTACSPTWATRCSATSGSMARAAPCRRSSRTGWSFIRPTSPVVGSCDSPGITRSTGSTRTASASPTPCGLRCPSPSSTNRSGSKASAPTVPTSIYLVDGGMLSNFPIGVFDRTDGRPPRWPTFGIKLSAPPACAVQERFCINGILDLAKAMVGTMTRFYDQMHIDDPAGLARTIFVDTLGVKATDFDIDEATQDLLYDKGCAATMKFLSTWDFESYVDKYRSSSPQERSVAVTM